MNDDEMEYRRAGLFVRLVAVLLDGLIVVVPLTFGLAAVTDYDVFSTEASFIQLAIYAVYEIFAIAKFGQTIGKRLAGIRVVTGSVPPSMTTLSLQASFIRYVVKSGDFLNLLMLAGVSAGSVSDVTGIWAIVVCVSLVSNRERRGIHDHAARTSVIYSPIKKPAT